MLSVVLALVSTVFFLEYLEIIVILSLLLLMLMGGMYKTNTYLEDMMFCSNEVNVLLNLMTISLLMLIILSTRLGADKYYCLLQMTLGVVLLMCFSSNNLLMFYIFFESSLLPILLLIISWGYQPERLQAGLYMILYTVFGSMPLFVVILFIYKFSYTFSLYLLMTSMYNIPMGVMYLGFMAFLVKLPVYSMHIWLPKAHVEAPLGGSMILAGALLKLGGYGLYMFNLLVSSSNVDVVIIGLVMLSMWGGLFAGMICLSQSDIKSMIAYSSVVHMSLVVMGVFSNTSWGLSSAMITMIAHGWVSSALFLIAATTYDKVGSRSFYYTKGLLVAYPSMALIWFVLTSVNMSVPPSINFVGELVAVPVSMWLNKYLLVVLLLIMFMSVCYNMYLYTKVNHGALNNYIVSSKGISSMSMMSTSSHMLPLLLILSMDYTCLSTGSCVYK